MATITATGTGTGRLAGNLQKRDLQRDIPCPFASKSGRWVVQYLDLQWRCRLIARIVGNYQRGEILTLEMPT